MSCEEWARLQPQCYHNQFQARPQDRLGITWTNCGGPMDGETETMHPAMNSTIERRGWCYVCEFGARKLRCVGPA